MAELKLDRSTQVRDNLVAARRREIAALYYRLAKETRNRADALKLNTSVSARLQRHRLNILSEQLSESHSGVNDKIESGIKSDIERTAKAVVDDNKAFLSQVGLSSNSAFSHVPKSTVESVINGNIYAKLPDGSNWTLSKAIWDDNARFNGDIDRIIAAGIAENKSSLEIARDLEKYVTGDAKKNFDWGKVYPGTRKAVDYNAQRLARTLPSHAYQRSLVLSTASNPFVYGYIWHTANSHRVCPICADMDGTFYPKGSLPLDHPNGMCYWECVTPDMTDVADRLADWATGEDSGVLSLISNHDITAFANYLKRTG